MKKFWIALTVVLLAIITALTVYIATSFKTTAQETAEAKPPEETVITAQVTDQKIQSILPVKCTATFGKTIELQTLDPAPNAQYTLIAVKKNEEVNQGRFVAEVNGEPLFVGIGPFSFYRDLHLNDRGPDAKMLNGILIALGYQTERVEEEADVFDDVSLEALGLLYADHGYEKPSKETGFKATSFIVLKKPETVTSEPREPGAVSDGPIAQISGAHKKLKCTGQAGELSPEVQSGQKIVIPTLGEKEFPIAVVDDQDAATSSVPGGENTSGEVGNPANSADQNPKKSVILVEDGNSFAELRGEISANLILAESSGKAPVVPSSAIWTKDQQTVVTVKEGDQEKDIPVKILFSANGYNQVEVIGADALHVGDSVKVLTQGAQ